MIDHIYFKRYRDVCKTNNKSHYWYVGVIVAKILFFFL